MPFLVRVYAMHPLAMLAGLCLVALTVPAYRLLDAERANVGAIPRAIDKQGDATRALLASESGKFRAAVLIAIAESRADVLARVDRGIGVTQQEIRATRAEASAHILGLAGVADRRLESIQVDLNTHGLIVERLAARELGRAVDGWVTMAQPISALAGELAHAAPALLEPLTDCEDNPSCFENRWKGLTFDLEQAMRAVKDAAPRVGKAAGDTSVSVASIAATGDKWVGRQLAPKNKKQTALAVIERFGLIGIRAWLLL